MSFLVARGTRNGYSFESYSPLPVSNIEGSKGKLMQLGVFTRVEPDGTEIDYTCAVFSSNRTPPVNVKQSWFCNFFQVSAKYKDQSGTADIDLKANPNFMSYNNEKKVGIFSFNFTNNNPPSIGGLGPSSFFTFYSPRDNAFYGVHYLGRYYMAEGSDNSVFWEKVSHFTPKLPFEIDISTEGGGDGEYDDNSSDTIGLPDLTTLNQNSISNTKFLTCYKMTPAQLSKLGAELWSDNIFTQISNTVLKPTDFIVNLSLLPVDVGGVTKLIKAGKILLNGAEGTLISQQFIRVDCGNLEVKKKWGGAIDYQTDVSIFLPFIGEQSLNANEVMGATLHVIYTVDILSGSCIASVRVIKDSLDAVLYQFSGNMASNYPITSADYATVFSGALQLAVGVGSLPSSGGVLSLVSATSNMLSGAGVKRTGSLSAAAGFMGIKKPYLILSRPIQSLPNNYNSFHGYVSNVTMKLKDCKGYTQVDSMHIDNVPCMEEEKTRLLQILKEGIII